MDLLGTLNALNNIQKLASKVEVAAQIKDRIDALAKDVNALVGAMDAVKVRLKEIQDCLKGMVKHD